MSTHMVDHLPSRVVERQQELRQPLGCELTEPAGKMASAVHGIAVIHPPGQLDHFHGDNCCMFDFQRKRKFLKTFFLYFKSFFLLPE